MASSTPNSKRRAPDPDSPGAASPSAASASTAVDNDFAALAAQLRAEFTDVSKDILETALAKQSDKFLSVVARTVGEATQAQAARSAAIEADVEALRATDERLAKQQLEMREQIKKLQAAMDVAEKTVPLVDAGNDFEREIDTSIIRVSAKDTVTKIELIKTLQPILTEASIDDSMYTVEGDTASKKFTVRFSGATHLALRRVNKTLEMLRLPDGAWRELEAPKVAGGAPSRLFLSRDKNRRAIRIEMDLRRLRRILTDALPGATYHADRIQGQLSCNWVPVVKVEPVADGSPSLLRWNQNYLNANPSLDRIALEDAFKASLPAAPAATWI